MENQPKRSKALIITIIVVILLFLLGWLVISKDIFGIKTSSIGSKIFSPLQPSDNSKITNKTDEKTLVQAGEDLQKGDSVSVFGTGPNNTPIVKKTSGNNAVLGYVDQNMISGDLGEITLGSRGFNAFWDSFSKFLGNLFNKKGNVINVSSAGWTYNPNTEGWIPPLGWKYNPDSGTWTLPDGTTFNAETGVITPSEGVSYNFNTGIWMMPDGSIYNNNTGVFIPSNGSVLSDDGIWTLSDGSTFNTNTGIWTDPNGSTLNINTGVWTAVNGSNFNSNTVVWTSAEGLSFNLNTGEFLPPADWEYDASILEWTPPINWTPEDWTPPSSTCANTADNYPMCTTSGGLCINDATNPPMCTTLPNGECLNGATNPPMCNNGDNNGNPDNICLNGATNYPDCDNGGWNDIAFPTVSVTADPMSVAKGGSSTITWESVNADTCSAVGITGAGTGKTGTFSTGALTTSKMFTVTCTGTGGTGTGSVFVMVTGTGGNFPTVSVTADPMSVAKGGSSTITWESVNADTCSAVGITGAGTGKTGTFSTGALTTSKMFTVTCTGTGGTGTGSVFVTVGNNSLPPTTTSFQCNDNLDNDGDKLIDEDDPECHAGGVILGTYLPTYNSEQNSSTECSDTIDNDRDSLIDSLDPACHIGGNITTGVYLPMHNSETTPATECSDTIDNDEDKLIDKSDPQCHLGGILKNAYVASHNSENSSPVGSNICLDIEQNPLTFNAKEKVELAALLRRFYLISSTLRTADDITTIYNEIEQQRSFIAELQELTAQCYAETDLLMVANGWKRHGNPWYTETKGGTFPYTSENSGYYDSTKLGTLNIIIDDGMTPLIGSDACRVVSGYYYGTLSTPAKIMGTGPLRDVQIGTEGKAGQSCNQFNNFPKYRSCTGMSTNIRNLATLVGGQGFDTTANAFLDNTPKIVNWAGEFIEDPYIKAGCKWKDGVYLDQAERILNIW